MKYKDKVELIKNEFAKEVPNLNIRSILDKAVIDNEIITPAQSMPYQKRIFNFYNLAATFGLVIVIFLSIFTFVPDYSFNNNNKLEIARNASYDLYSNNALNLVMLIEKNSNQTIDTFEDININSNVEAVNPYMYLVELMFNEDIYVEKEASDNLEYDYIYHYHINNIDKDVETYSIYIKIYKNQIKFLVYGKRKQYLILGSIETNTLINLVYTEGSKEFLYSSKIIDNVINYNIEIINNDNLLSSAKLTIDSDEQITINDRITKNVYNIYPRKHEFKIDYSKGYDKLNNKEFTIKIDKNSYIYAVENENIVKER